MADSELSISSSTGYSSSDSNISTSSHHENPVLPQQSSQTLISQKIYHLSISCMCQQKCYQKESPDQWGIWLQHTDKMSKSTRKTHAFYLMTSTLDIEHINPRYSLPYVGHVCREFFRIFWGLGKNQLRTMTHFVIHGNKNMDPPAHGNIGRLPRHGFSEEQKNRVLQFLAALKQNHGESIATRQYKRRSVKGITTTQIEIAEITFLPSHYSYSRLCDSYNDEHKDHSISISSFYRIWKQSDEFRLLKIRKPAKDVCDECAILKTGIQYIPSHDNKNLETIHEQIIQHTTEYRKCRECYENDRKASSIDTCETRCHSFDFQQIVEIPHAPLQPGAWYYWSPFKLHVFGIVNEGSQQHYHTVYTESQQGKGANQVISLLHCYLTTDDNIARTIYLWADNCGGQNKNKTMIWYLSWFIQQSTIAPDSALELRFQIKGHTRNSVDRGFAITKNEANRSYFWYPEDYLQVIERANKHGDIHAISFIDEPNRSTTVFRDWDSAFSRLMRPVTGIQQFQFFRFEACIPGMVLMKRLPEDNWTAFNLLKRDTSVEQFLRINPLPLHNIGHLAEKRHDMWSKYGQYVPTDNSGKRKWLYQEPEPELISQVRKIKNTRAIDRHKGKERVNIDIANDSLHQEHECNSPQYSHTGTGLKKRGRPPGSRNKSKILEEKAARSEVSKHR